MFCGCTNDPHEGESNSYVCPVCLAHPGSLPVPNKEAISKILLFGTAVGGTLSDYTEFDRKNYFYPDIPKAYQISQYAFPFISGGNILDIELTRVHLEEDTARSQHDKGAFSVVDFNRAGVPLMELVTEPVIHDAKTAGSFARELQLLLRTLDISAANMDRGEMRVEANISISSSEELGTKVEVKNLNSFKSVEMAIDYEIKRQAEVIESGGEVVQETRGWDEAKLKTFSQRKKESAHDYRYFPDPDLPKIAVSKEREFEATTLVEKLPILPIEKRTILSKQGIASDTIETILANPIVDRALTEYIKEECSNDFVRKATNYLLTDALPIVSEHNIDAIPTRQFAELMDAILDGKINSRVAKDILPTVLKNQTAPLEYAEKQGLLQSDSEGDLVVLVQQIVTEQADVVAEYKAGKESALQFLVGQGMKATKGSANPALLAQLLKKTLDS